MSSADQPPPGDEVPVDPQADAPVATATPEAPAEEEPAPPPAPADTPTQAVLDALSAELEASLVDSVEQQGELWIRVRVEDWARIAQVLRHQLGFDYFCYLSGIDWMPHTWPNPKVEGEEEDGETSDGAQSDEPQPELEPAPEPGDGKRYETGIAGGDSRFQVLARVYSTTRHLGVTLKADLDDDSPSAPTWTEVYRGADWHERETWEMYGFDFAGHPNLIHLYLPSGFEGFPLRKDFPLLAREVKPWPGLVDVEPFPPGTDTDGSPDPASLPPEEGD